jgi:hypothetical protein
MSLANFEGLFFEVRDEWLSKKIAIPMKQLKDFVEVEFSGTMFL